MRLSERVIDWTERGLIPDPLVRWGIRRNCAVRLRDPAAEPTRRAELLEAMRRGPLAPVPEKANAQHYEVPADLFRLALGKHLKYSCGYWPAGVATLDAAEEAALALTCARAELADGQDVLELGCGWGSLSLWLAEHFPGSRITAVSNSASQREYITARARERGVNNLRVVTADVNHFDPGVRFDRIVSVEMFEHLRNYEELFRRVAAWLNPAGKLFVHVFCHRTLAYFYEEDGPANWLGRHFFSGGLMPSADLLPSFQGRLNLERQWHWDGTHYQKTAEAWCANLTRRRAEVVAVLARAYGAAEARRWFQRWRVFFLACAEMFGYRGGQEWGVAHYLFACSHHAPRDEQGTSPSRGA